MRVLHLDLDAFFASVEQRDKPSLRGKPVVVGGIGIRGVVATASYEARAFGVHSAMPMSQARRLCPHAAFLPGRFHEYRATSERVMATLRELSASVEQLSVDEAFVAITPTKRKPASANDERALAEGLRTVIAESTGITASVGIASSKLMAKIASEQAKPDGCVVIPAGSELEVLHPLPVRTLPGVGPTTATGLTHVGIRTVGDLARFAEEDLARITGNTHARALLQLAHARDDRAIHNARESKSISVEDTFDQDIVDPKLLVALLNKLTDTLVRRLVKARQSGRTVTVKVRRYDFSTHTRSFTLPAGTDNARTIASVATTLLSEADTSGGVRLLGVGLSGLSDWVQDDLFSNNNDRDIERGIASTPGEFANSPGTHMESSAAEQPQWTPGLDVAHNDHGDGWVWGSGSGRVTVRFETTSTPPGPIYTFDANDPGLRPLK